MARLPQPGSDNGTWGEILNEYLSQSLKSDGSIKDNAVTNDAIAPDAITANEIEDGSITEAQLTGAVQTKLNASAGTPDWDDIAGKPAVIAAGADQATARAAIGAGTSNLALGTTASTAKAGDYVPTKADVGLGNVDNTSDTAKPVSTATQTALNAKANDNAVVKLTGDQAISGNKTLTGNLMVVNNDGDTSRVVLNNTNANQVFEFGVNTGGNWSVWDSSHSKGPLLIAPNAGGGLSINTDRNTMSQQLDMANNPVIGLPVPTAPTHAVRKSYVDELLSGVAQSSLPYVSTLGKWNTAVARRAVRHPRMLVVGDSASSARRSWQHQIAGRMYFDPAMADVQAGYMEVPFATGLYSGDEIRFNGVGHLTDIDLLVATGSDEGAIQVGDYRYDEGSWRTPWTLGDHYSTSFPPHGLIDKYRIDNMSGANSLTIRGSGHPDGTWWLGMNARVGSAPLDVMSLAVPGVTSQWWRDQMVADISNIDNWGAASIKALAEGFGPDLIIIALGANDLDNPGIINDVDTHLTQVIAAWRALHPNADIALQTYWQPSWGVVRDQVIATAAAENVALFDVWPKIPPYAQHPGLYSDEYHLNDYGQRLVADIAIQQLGIPQS